MELVGMELMEFMELILVGIMGRVVWPQFLLLQHPQFPQLPQIPF